jgi:uncharacterized protein (TIGR02246 family)
LSNQEHVLEANRKFYEALCLLDLDLMTAVWLPDDCTRCVHPGWMMLEGWDTIRESFRRIFQNTQFMRVSVSLISVHLEDDTAWVCCVEKISSSGEGHIDSAHVQATNVFLRRQGRWLLALHHASHLPPALQPGTGEETVQ